MEEDLSLWRVARKPRQGADYRIKYQGQEADARAHFKAIADALRQGAVVLLAPQQPLATCLTLFTERTSAPNLRSRW